LPTDLLCRCCDAPLRRSFADLGASPLANALLRPEELLRPEPFYSLHVLVCDECLLVQLPEMESPEAIFSDYTYFSSYSDSWLAHAREYASMACERFALGSTSQVVEIASNDGYLLRWFRDRGIPVLGVEPAANVATVAQQAGIPTRVGFFGARLAEQLAAEGIRADLLVGNNVLAHVPALRDFVAGLARLLAPQGWLTMEFPHLLRLVAENQFDTIYHEHFSYFSLLAVERVFGTAGLVVVDVDELPTHGGSLRVYVRHRGVAEPSPRVAALRQREVAAGMREPAYYAAFEARVRATKRGLLRFLIGAKEEGRTIVGYGAPAKGNTLLNYCGIGRDFLDYTVDRSPHKQGRLLPGTRIPIRAPEEIFATRPDYVLILPWNLRQEIASQMSGIRAWGGRFVVAIPEVEVW
jgi:SAM-dependent methyltransferase